MGAANANGAPLSTERRLRLQLEPSYGFGVTTTLPLDGKLMISGVLVAAPGGVVGPGVAMTTG
jgi:hypothetical protein